VIVRKIDLHAPAQAPPARAPSLSLEGQVQKALNLFLPLKSPAQMPAVLTALQAAAPQVHEALGSLQYVHFARFLPSQDGSTLMVITTYDGGLDSYLMDFVATMGEIFTAILTFVRDAPRLPVNRYPRDFVDFVKKHNVAQVGVWSAYPDVTVIDVLSGTRQL
jgi:hypothetical protein